MAFHAEVGTSTIAAGTSVPSTGLSEADRKAFERDAKIGLLATVNRDGEPHVTLITSIQARGPRELMFGQFTEGLSKAHVMENPRTAFLVMGPERTIWRGTARWTRKAKSGEDYELYNRKPMFRYNAYFGIHTVHYLEVVELAGKETLSTARLVGGTLATMLIRPSARSGENERVLTPWAQRHLSKVETLKFASYVSGDGYPAITVPLACRAVDDRRLVFLPPRPRPDFVDGQSVAVLAVNLQTESVLVRGRFAGYERHAGVDTGSIDVDWVYNSMPPKHGQIYPREPLQPVTNFDPAQGAARPAALSIDVRR